MTRMKITELPEGTEVLVPYPSEEDGVLWNELEFPVRGYASLDDKERGTIKVDAAGLCPQWMNEKHVLPIPQRGDIWKWTANEKLYFLAVATEKGIELIDLYNAVPLSSSTPIYLWENKFYLHKRKVP